MKMNSLRWLFFILLVTVSCVQPPKFSITDITQLSFEGDNGEAYFHPDNKTLI